MISLTYLALAFVLIALTITLAVWIVMENNLGTDAAGLEQDCGDEGGAKKSDSMTMTDWINAVTSVVVGVFCGIAALYLLQLVMSGFWPLAIIVVVFILVFLAFDGLLDRLFEKVFPSGIRAVRKPAASRRSPLLRRLSLPVGITIGLALAWFDLADVLLQIL